MDRFLAMQVFTRVAELESFSEAARQLSLSKSAVSKQISALEDKLGARLLNRTTRRLSLTEAGQGYYGWAQRILADVEEAERLVGAGEVDPKGRLKISAPLSFGFRCLAPVLPGLAAQYPKLEVDVRLTDRYVDVVAEGFDVAVRIGKLQDTSLIARRVSQTRRLVCAAPSYLQQYGTPREPSDLIGRDCISYTFDGRMRPWRFRGKDDKEIVIAAKSRIAVDNGDAMLAMAENGAGFAQVPAFIVADALKDGRLVRVLEDFEEEALPISALYPSGRNLSAKVRVFVDFLAQTFGSDPDWDNL